MDGKVAQFIEITGADSTQAEFFLQSANEDLEAAMETYFSTGGAMPAPAAPAPLAVPTSGEAMDEDDAADADLQAAIAQSKNEPVGAPSSRQAPSGGAQTLGGGPAPAASTTPKPSSSSSSSSSSASSGYKAPAAKIRSTPSNNRFGTFASMHHKDEDEDEEDRKKPQNYFAGGEKSGISVEDPNKKGGDGPNDIVRNILKKAQEGSASRSESPQPQASTSRAFGGAGNTLGNEDTPSTSTAEPASAPQAEPSGMPGMLRNLFGGGGTGAGGPPPFGRMFGRPEQARAESSEDEDLPEDYQEENVTRHLTLWRDGFSVQDGPLLRYDNPENMQTLTAIQNGTAPGHVLNVRYGQHVELRVAKRTDEDYIAPPPKPAKPFSGSGNRLGSPAPAMTSRPPAAQPPSILSGGTSALPPSDTTPFEVDGTAPTTTLQIRLGDGERQTQRFNHTHTVGDIRRFINAGHPGMSERGYVLLTTFPNKELSDDAQTIKDAGVLGSVIVQKWT